MTPDDDAGAVQPRAKVRVYRFPNHLRHKAMGARKVGGPGLIAEQALRAAEADFEKASEDYPDWALGHVNRLYREHLACLQSVDRRHQAFRALNDLAHDMRGQGGAFGYELVSDFAESLYEFTQPRDSYGDHHVELVKAHVDAINAVIKDRIKGDGGAVGQALIAELERAIKKYANSRQRPPEQPALPPPAPQRALPPPR